MCSLPTTQKHLPTSRRSGSPHARGLIAVADCSSAIETPPATNRLRNSGALPYATWLTADVSAVEKWKDSKEMGCNQTNQLLNRGQQNSVLFAQRPVSHESFLEALPALGFPLSGVACITFLTFLGFWLRLVQS